MWTWPSAPGIRRGRRAAAISLASLLAVAGCATTGPTPSPIEPTDGSPTASGAPFLTQPVTPAPSATGATALARNPAPFVEGPAYGPTIDPADFVEAIDNPFFPMVAGARFVFDGAEHIEVDVLPETKVILGVTVTVVRDRVFEDGDLIEDTLDWYAQDVDGNVWYFGEETAEYENGEVVSTAGSWEAGVDGAQPGIIMLADPRVGDVYRQEFYGGEAEDIGEITALEGEVSVEAGSWSGSDVLVTEEWTPLEPDVRERKTYVRGQGVVEILTIEGGDERTTLIRATFPR